MKNKKIIIFFSVLLIIILIGGYSAIKYVKQKQMQTIADEYIPQEEITEQQYRQTIVSLYFLDKESNKIVPEARLVDIKEIINNPYDKLMELLIDGPKNDKNEVLMPEGTKIVKTYTDGDCVILDFSTEFLNYKKENKNNLIDSIVNTLTELTEINKVKIIINGNNNEEFNEIYELKNIL